MRSLTLNTTTFSSVINSTLNLPSSNITFKQSVSFSTIDQNNNNAAFLEGFKISGPSGIGVSPIFIAGGTKCVIPLSTSSGNGAPYLKIWFPQNSGTILTLTYCVANSASPDGYYDYQTGVPTIYYNALRAWINLVPASPTSLTGPGGTPKTRSLKFSSYGTSTNKPANSVTFYINFQGTFVGSTAPLTS